MDGLGSDVDVCFLLTTNRVDLLETALAQRPGRVDLAVEIPLPNEEGRRRLLEIYGRGIDFDPADLQRVVERVAGVPASFVKELTRRATLISAERGSVRTEAADVDEAVDELLGAREELTRHLLGAEQGHPLPAAARSASGEGWFAYPAHPAPSRITR
jgi:cell division protease FtsH